MKFAAFINVLISLLVVFIVFNLLVPFSSKEGFTEGAISRPQQRAGPQQGAMPLRARPQGAMLQRAGPQQGAMPQRAGPQQGAMPQRAGPKGAMLRRR